MFAEIGKQNRLERPEQQQAEERKEGRRYTYREKFSFEKLKEGMKVKLNI